MATTAELRAGGRHLIGKIMALDLNTKYLQNKSIMLVGVILFQQVPEIELYIHI